MSVDLEEPPSKPHRRPYRGPFRDAVYSPLPLFGPEKLIGESEALYRLFTLIDTAAQVDQNILIQGETGTGKNLVARTIHSRSDRSQNWLIVVNCAVVEPGELESILVGSSRPTSVGLFEAVPGGTIAFDHIDQLDGGEQARLNHILETHACNCPPNDGTAAFDVRLLFLATRRLPNADFNEDLYYRINQFPIRVPPLRARPGDIVHIARQFLRRMPGHQDLDLEQPLSPGAKTALRSYDWPGNVRELRNAITRAASVCEAPRVQADDLPPSIREAGAAVQQEPIPSTNGEDEHSEVSQHESTPLFTGGDDAIPEIEEVKRVAVKRAYTLCEGDVDRAAVELGIARSTMYRLLKQYDLK